MKILKIEYSQAHWLIDRQICKIGYVQAGDPGYLFIGNGKLS